MFGMGFTVSMNVHSMGRGTVYVFDDLGYELRRMAEALDTFTKMLRECKTALVHLMRPMLVELRRVARAPVAEMISQTTPEIAQRRAGRRKRHSAGHMNFYKVKA